MTQGNSSGKSPRPRGSARKAPPPASARLNLTPAQQEQIVAGILLVIAALTAFGAFNLSSGNILDGWTGVLSVLFGWGRFLAPFFFAGFGIWLLLDSLDMRPDIGWERPLALILAFFCIATFLQIIAVNFMSLSKTSFQAAQIGLGGGLMGHLLYDVLVGGLGLAGALLVLLVVFAIALILFFNISLPQLFHALGQGWGQVTALFTRAPDIKIARNGRERVPTEMVTAPPKKTTDSRRPTTETMPRLPADFGADELLVEESPARSPVSAHIVGGGGAAQILVHREWRLPRVPDILEESVEQDASPHEIRERVKKIEETLLHFGVPAKVVEVNQGPTITQFGVEPGFLQQKSADGTMRPVKVKVNRISALQHDLELALAAAPIRVEAPVPGKAIVGIEVPNSQISRVSLRGVMESEEFQRVRAKSALAFALGQDVSGQPIVADLAKMPHLLVAGATGSGKSVAVNAMITCMLMTNTPDDLQFVMVDPKRVELSAFNGIPHLLAPVVVDMDLAVAALNRTVQEMDDRYRKFSQVGARNIENFNALPEEKRRGPKLPYLILVVDELADLMMTSPDEVEHTVTRLAQMARATGIHLVLATQRPSVDVVTGLIKANFPSRISFAVTSQVDSRVVLDTPGAEKLLGRGDMLYMASDSSKLSRLQGCFVSDKELEKLVTYWKGFVEVVPPQTTTDSGRLTTGSPPPPQLRVSPSAVSGPSSGLQQGALWNLTAEPKKSEEDDLLDQAIQIVQDNDRASVSLLQRKLRIGYSRAARLMELLEQKGYVGQDEGPTKGRAVLPPPPPMPAPKPSPAKTGAPAPNNPASQASGRASTNSAPPQTPPRSNTPTANASAKTPTPDSHAERKFVENDLDGFDDWTDEDWADLDKS
jgi:S-DNA-T family DNA segregation ATPase FtsK/SpoIIIE